MRHFCRENGEGLRVLDGIDAKSLLIVAAVSTYVFGFLFRDQIYTRLLVVIGSSFYIFYYATVGPTPLWDAIIGSALIALSSLQGLLLLLWGRMEIAVPRSARHIYTSFGKIEPGHFRRLIKFADRRVIDAPLVLVEQNKRPDMLWYLVDGNATLRREGQDDVVLSGPAFIGEIAWMTTGLASATVIADAGVELLGWTRNDLRRAMRYNAKLEIALESLIAQDIARKLAKSRPFESAPADAQVGGTLYPAMASENV